MNPDVFFAILSALALVESYRERAVDDLRVIFGMLLGPGEGLVNSAITCLRLAFGLNAVALCARALIGDGVA